MQGFRGISIAGLLLLTLGLSSQRSFVGQPQGLVIIVMTRDGHSVTDLQEKDFTVFDQGSIPPITSFRAIRSECGLGPAISYVDFSINRPNRSWDCFPRYELGFDSTATIRHGSPEIKIKRPGLKILVAR
jgi:hypothetical protein